MEILKQFAESAGSLLPTALAIVGAVLVILAVAAIQLSGGAGAFDTQPVVLRVLALAVPYLAAPALTSYILVTGKNQGEHP